MQKQLNQVAEFYNNFGQTVRDRPQFPSSDTLVLRQVILQEEVTELEMASLKRDMVAATDAVCDILYVLLGTAHELGLGPVLEKCFDEVHRSNMSKLDQDGKPIYRTDGKVLKGPNYSKPELSSIISENCY